MNKNKRMNVVTGATGNNGFLNGIDTFYRENIEHENQSKENAEVCHMNKNEHTYI